jgi:hypothetical protein
MNFKPTSTKSIVSAFVPLILAVIAFKYKYCTDCDAEALRAQQQTIAAIVLIGLCIYNICCMEHHGEARADLQ